MITENFVVCARERMYIHTSLVSSIGNSHSIAVTIDNSKRT